MQQRVQSYDQTIKHIQFLKFSTFIAIIIRSNKITLSREKETLRSLEFRKRFPTNNPQKLYQQSGLKKNRSKN